MGQSRKKSKAAVASLPNLPVCVPKDADTWQEWGRVRNIHAQPRIVIALIMAYIFRLYMLMHRIKAGRLLTQRPFTPCRYAVGIL